MPDRRVQAAIDHWAPRFITMGVDYNEFVRTTGRIERWDDWLDAWSRVAVEHMELAETAERAGRARSAGEAYLHAALCWHFGKFVWMLDAAGLDSTKEEFFHHENAFLHRGMATLSMDGPGQGETGFALPIRPDYEVAVAAMLDALEGRDDVDIDRVGAVGVSLGGYYAPRAAAFEPRLRAVAAVSGPYEFGAQWDELPPLTREAFTVRSGARDETEARERAAALTLSPLVADWMAERLARAR